MGRISVFILLAVAPFATVAVKYRRPEAFLPSDARVQILEERQLAWLASTARGGGGAGGDSDGALADGDEKQERLVDMMFDNDNIANGRDASDDDTIEVVDAMEGEDDDDAPISSREDSLGYPSVGVKQHVSKKSNAVGDPDGEGSSDDEDEDELEELLSEEWDDTAAAMSALEGDDSTSQSTPTIAQSTPTIAVQQMEVEVEYTMEENDIVRADNEDDETTPSTLTKGSSSSKSGGSGSGGGGAGIGVRFAQRFKRGRRGGSSSTNSATSTATTTTTTAESGADEPSHARASSTMEQHLLDAWQPYVFLPPFSNGWTYLKDHARALDADGRTRLDRRTLYGGLLLEWSSSSSSSGTSSSSSTTSTSLSTSRSHRKFLDGDVSQRLQSSLSLATQPTWRQSFPRPNAIRLYDTTVDAATALAGCNMAMQESVALALAHSLGVPLVVLDDTVLLSVKQQLQRDGYSDDDVKPAALIHSVLALARQGALSSLAATSNSPVGGPDKTACISKVMRSDLDAGLDDPFDDRATSSYNEMLTWEEAWRGMPTNATISAAAATTTRNQRDTPLVIFLRTQAATSLLKSKAAVDVLLTECNSTDSRTFLILGKGIDVTTPSLPEPEPQKIPSWAEQGLMSRNLQGAAPWFGFPPHNQNASGQNDPEGSRRFNIFLARTMDSSGTPGIVGAIAPPEAGNLFPHMMAMQAHKQMDENNDSDDSPAASELKRWTRLLQQQMHTNSGMPLPPPQFFNATISSSSEGDDGMPQLSPEVIQQTLEFAMSEMLDRLAQLNEEGNSSPDISPGLQKAFAQVLRNEQLRRGISENLARAAPALSDPKCQGVLLSVFVPPPTFHAMPPSNLDASSASDKDHKDQPHNMGNWFAKMLSHQDEADSKKDRSEEEKLSAMQKRVRTMAAAAAVRVAETSKEEKKQEKHESKSARNLAKLEALCRPIVVKTPADPVRAKSWEAWIGRERGAVIFRQNRQILNEQLERHKLSLQERTGTRGAGSALRQMLSVRVLAAEMEEVIKRAIELEAAKSQRSFESSNATNANEIGLDVDVTLSQIVLTEDGLVATSDILDASSTRPAAPAIQFLHPSSVEAALTSVCRISPSPAGWLAVASDPAPHRSRDEISALAQDKHERALVSQVVSPQDIGVTYDMIGGLSEVKELLRQSITYPLKFPHLYSEGIAREAVKGVLLFGPPGTGKTMLAKAVATEGGASFLSVDASSVENKWLGESEKNAKAVFTLARRLAPCVIFIDEVDSLLSSREGSSDDSAHGTLTSVKTTMMSEWDGLNSGTNGEGRSDRVVVIGSTNRPYDLDEAVLRRFPRRILVDLPDLKTRTEILEVTLAENRLDPGVNLTEIAERLEGYTGSDIKECCREAVVQISHEQARMLDQGIQSIGRDDAVEGGGGSSLQRLRSVTMEDFEKALRKLKRSVSEKGRELAKVWEWNDEYGEMKRQGKSTPHLANMYL